MTQRHKRYLQLLAFVTCIAPALSWAQADVKPRCIDYTSVGMSSCKQVVSEQKTVSETVSIPAPVVEFERPNKAVSKTLDDRIDEFLENHGKPPREFVAFSLEPTLENALIWAKKNREIIERNQKLTDAWNQAQTILDAREQGGGPVPALPEELMPVPDFTPIIQREVEGQPQKAAKPLTPQALSASNLNRTQSVVGGRIGGSVSSLGGQEPISISYYFSAECPYCKKFESEIKSVIKDMKDKVSVTCVDMTPSGQAAENVLGKIDCAWRPLQVGEMEKMGIQSTPSLIIDRHQGGSLERVTGFVDAKSLKDYLLGAK